MKSVDKLLIIDSKIKYINDNILKNKSWKLKYENKGANNYCIVVILKNKELFCSKFETYSSVINCLSLFEFMFNKSLNEKKEGK